MKFHVGQDAQSTAAELYRAVSKREKGSLLGDPTQNSKNRTA